MPNFEDPLIAEDIKTYLASTDDFQFEMEVHRLCAAAGLETEHGGTYTDSVTKQNRQFDLRARSRQGQLTLNLAVECKNLSPSGAFLISRVKRRKQEEFYDALVSHVTPSKAWHTGGLRMHNHIIVGDGVWVGKSTAHVRRKKDKPSILDSKDGDLYTTWNQAIASAEAWLLSGAAEPVKTRYAFGVLILPIMVVPDGVLWVVDYSTTGQVLNGPVNVHQADLFIGKKIQQLDYVFPNLHVFTKTGFTEFLAFLEDEALSHEVFTDELREKLDHYDR